MSLVSPDPASGETAKDRRSLLLEGLFGGHSLLLFLAGGGGFPCHPGQDGAADVGHVFALGQLAVDVDVVDDDIAGVLIDDALGAVSEFLGILLGPPILEIAFRVELAAFVVEAVSELVADSRAGVAVVGRVVLFGVVERGLEDAGGKVDVVHLGVVVGVDGRPAYRFCSSSASTRR